MTVLGEASAERRVWSWFPTAMLVVALAATTAVYARFYAFLPDGAWQGSLAAILVVSVAGIVLCFWSRYAAPALFSCAAMAYILANLLVFSATFSTPLNVNAALSSAPVLMTAAFFWIGRQLGFSRLLRLTGSAALLYVLFYLPLGFIVSELPDLLPASIYRLLTLRDGAGLRANARPDRVVAYLGLLAFGWASALSNFRTRPSTGQSLLLLLFGAAILLTNSRSFMLCVAAVSVLYLVVGSSTRTFAICLGALVLACLAYGAFLLAQHNPFALFAYDGSGAIRVRSFDTASYWIARLPLLGVGTPPSLDIEAYYVGGQAFFPSDLGPVGILYSHGVLGLLLWLWVPFWLRPRAGAASPLSAALTLTISILLAYQVIAPALWYGGGTLLFALWAAHQLAQKAIPQQH